MYHASHTLKTQVTDKPFTVFADIHLTEQVRETTAATICVFLTCPSSRHNFQGRRHLKIISSSNAKEPSSVRVAFSLVQQQLVLVFIDEPHSHKPLLDKHHGRLNNFCFKEENTSVSLKFACLHAKCLLDGLFSFYSFNFRRPDVTTKNHNSSEVKV